ncbi:MAG: hypothetical protein JWM27_4633, partial [Gemmatimonadetes bacterium]|nr:hypothetical protein [Gemmatimonadota bacterium]MDB4948943.1 hypothetical protein [Gemmatimonadota bacterium]MDB4951251.1 hypothetical protein [Gemmatimonadota bacterium]MDB4951885.1 hypothetical protein [Gemmatimonadota bacterium]MDB4951984.1 hypothetical protein [Gemmatimonadota bacterium]
MNTEAAGRRRFEGYLECLRNAV